MLLKKVRRLLNRHPFLYRTRFALITDVASSKESFDCPSILPRHIASCVPSTFSKKIRSLKLDPTDSFESAKEIAFDLSNGHKRGKGLGRDSPTVLDLIYNGDAGVCSDYSQVYLGLCTAAGIPAREWGVTEDLLPEKHTLGHAFNEIYSNRLRKWIFIDAYRSLYATDKTTGLPLSVTEIIDFTTAAVDYRIKFHYIDSSQRGLESYPHECIYLNPRNVYFLLINNRIFEQDKFLARTSFLPLPASHILMFLAGKYQKYMIYTNHHNEKLMAHKLQALRESFLPTGLHKSRR